jgi:uncharacterized repeat protein (TIGR03803 family)
LNIRYALILAAASLLAISASASTSAKVIHNFQSSTGDSAFSTLVFDSAGNLYGTTETGGGTACDEGCGTVFRLAPTSGGGWNYQVLHAFRLDNGDGIYPTFTSPLVLDKAGNVYGTTWEGGSLGAGCVFEVSPQPDGSWTEKVIHSFTASPDGSEPQAGLVMDAAGNLYGTTVEGGVNGDGAIFELSPSSGGGWNEKVIYSFAGPDGASPYDPPTIDAAGNLYGTASTGGAHNVGVVFELSPNSSGWIEKILYNFTGRQDGGYPQAGLLLDSEGNLDGVNFDNQTDSESNGVVFRLTPNAQGGWTESTLHAFTGTDGEDPRGPLSQDSAGNLYGTAYIGGVNGTGTVYKLSPNSKGGWSVQVLDDFAGSTGGYAPLGGVIPDSLGRIYGTTVYGGADSAGTIFVLQQ